MIPSLQVDAGTSRADLVRIAHVLLGLGPRTLETATLPWKAPITLVGGQQVLDLADGTQGFARTFSEAGTVAQLNALLDQPVTPSPAAVDCR